MELHIETSGLVGDRLFINDKHGVTVAEVHVLARDAAPLITNAVNTHAELVQALEYQLCPICQHTLAMHATTKDGCQAVPHNEPCGCDGSQSISAIAALRKATLVS